MQEGKKGSECESEPLGARDRQAGKHGARTWARGPSASVVFKHSRVTDLRLWGIIAGAVCAREPAGHNGGEFVLRVVNETEIPRESNVGTD